MRRLSATIAMIGVLSASTASGLAFVWPGVASAKPAGIRDVQVAPVISGAVGEAPWAVRTWRVPEQGSLPPSSSSCLQVGQLQGSRLVRQFANGLVRVMRFGDRSICGALRLDPTDERVDPELSPLLVERLVDDPRGRAPRLVHTLVAGIIPSSVEQVGLSASGLAQHVTFNPRTRAFLAVLPGTVRRADLELSFRFAHGRQVLDFGSGRIGTGGDEPLAPGSEHVAITLDDSRLPRPLALVVYRISVPAGRGATVEPCAEPAEIVDGEPGAYNPTWGDFLDAPTLVGLPEFTDNWAPTGTPASMIGSCLNGIDDFSQGPVGALGVRRLAPNLVAVHGFLAPGVRRLKVVPPSGGAFYAKIDPASRAFFAPISARGKLGEKARLLATGGPPRRRMVTIALGDQETPTSFGYQLRDHRTIHVVWTGGFEPFIGADVSRSAHRLVVRVLQLFPPDFAPDGLQYASPAIAIYKCANIHLRAALPPHVIIVDGATGHPVRPARLYAPPHGANCPNVRPGQRVKAAITTGTS